MEIRSRCLFCRTQYYRRFDLSVMKHILFLRHFYPWPWFQAHLSVTGLSQVVRKRTRNKQWLFTSWLGTEMPCTHVGISSHFTLSSKRAIATWLTYLTLDTPSSLAMGDACPLNLTWANLYFSKTTHSAPSRNQEFNSPLPSAFSFLWMLISESVAYTIF